MTILGWVLEHAVLKAFHFHHLILQTPYQNRDLGHLSMKRLTCFFVCLFQNICAPALELFDSEDLGHHALIVVAG